MNVATFVIGSAWGAKSVIVRLTALCGQLTFSPRRHYVVTVERVDPRGAPWQMRKIRAIVGELAEFSGEDAEVLYEQLLARRFGVEELPLGDGRTWARPARRVSDMTFDERNAYTDWLQALAAEMGVVLRR